MSLASMPKRSRTPSSILGLNFQSGRLEGVVLRRSNGSVHVQQTVSAALALNPLNGDPELAGREIRNHLEQAGIRQRQCVVCVPLAWALTLPVKVPAMPAEDLPSFLEIEAERGFPYSPEALSVASSLHQLPSGEAQAFLVAIQRQPLEQLEKVLRAAQLRPVSFTLALPSLQPARLEPDRGVLSLLPGETTVDLQITALGGWVALRAIEGAIETEGGQRQLQPDVLNREIRVTLGQLPAELRQKVRTVRLFGAGEFVQRTEAALRPRLEAMGLVVERVAEYSPGRLTKHPPPNSPVSPAFSAAAARLAGEAAPLEFLPPRVSAFRRLTARFSSKRLGWIGAAAAAAAVLVASAVAFQQWQLSRLHSEWSSIEPRVRELEDLQNQIRRFRPWFDESFQHLSILRRVTEAFPVEGLVTAKTLEIREQNGVTCSGTARDNAAFLKMLDQLRATKEVGGLKVDQVRGKTPLQFTLNFQWGRGGANEN